MVDQQPHVQNTCYGICIYPGQDSTVTPQMLRSDNDGGDEDPFMVSPAKESICLTKYMIPYRVKNVRLFDTQLVAIAFNEEKDMVENQEKDVFCWHNPVAERFLYALGFDVDFDKCIYGPVCIYPHTTTRTDTGIDVEKSEKKQPHRRWFTSTIQDRLMKGIQQTIQNTKEHWAPDILDVAKSLDVLDPDAFVENESHIVSIQATLCFSDQSSYCVTHNDSDDGVCIITRPGKRPDSKIQAMWRHLHKGIGNETQQNYLNNTTLHNLKEPQQGIQGETPSQSLLSEEQMRYEEVD
jgi:hypothetical protein